MATLVSPGSVVTITDESFGTGSGPGTVPLIIVASAQDKLNSAGDAIASGTLKQNAGKLYILSSQKELLQTFGTPTFHSVGGVSLHAYPLNEYGLHTAYSYLGISNRALCIRADVDLNQLQPSSVEPVADPADGTVWLDLSQTNVGLNVFNATSGRWEAKTVTMYEGAVDINGAPTAAPNSAEYLMVVGRRDLSGDDYAENKLWYRKIGDATWYKLTESVANGLTPQKDIQYSSVWPTTRQTLVGALATGDLWISTTKIDFPVKIFDATSGNFVSVEVPAFEDTASANSFYQTPVAGDLFVQYDARETDNPFDTETVYQHVIKRHNGKATLDIVSDFVFGSMPSVTLSINNGAGFSVSGTAASVAASINVAMVNQSQVTVTASVADGKLVLTDTSGNDIIVDANDDDDFGIKSGTHSNWEDLTYVASASAPTGVLEDGTLWYNPDFKVDILVNDGTAWQDYTAGTVYVQASAPSTPAAGDIWVDTDQLDEYPVIYKRGVSAWSQIDSTDQTSPFGVIFADARKLNSGALDADQPNPSAYPIGMLLFNTRYSTRIVKEYYNSYEINGNTITNVWVNRSGNNQDGSLIAGSAAVKKVITQAMAAAISASEEIRSENIFFNLIAAPGYPELIDEMTSLNVDRKETAFVIGDTPMTLSPSTTELQAWATNANLAPSNGDDGLITTNAYLGVFYPSGLSTALDGTEVVVPASHMVLRTFAYNDQVAYQWFAPAGLNRGIITNATSVGYVDDEGEYVSISLNEGQRDVLYTNNINPIRQDASTGIVVWGQKTRSPVESAMSRINVARLINYLRYRLDRMVQPFIFEQNDSKTRASVKTLIDSFLSELITLRGLTDFVVVVDETNNTPARIDRNELWIDIAIVPTKSVEFIYIPIRIKSTGSDLGA
jgi:hypothetical protein